MEGSFHSGLLAPHFWWPPKHVNNKARWIFAEIFQNIHFEQRHLAGFENTKSIEIYVYIFKGIDPHNAELQTCKVDASFHCSQSQSPDTDLIESHLSVIITVKSNFQMICCVFVNQFKFHE